MERFVRSAILRRSYSVFSLLFPVDVMERLFLSAICSSDDMGFSRTFEPLILTKYGYGYSFTHNGEAECQVGNRVVEINFCDFFSLKEPCFFFVYFGFFSY